jgi:bifunctional non-homologous end joining protein LigD
MLLPEGDAQSMPPQTPTKAIRHKTGITHYVVGGSLETQLALVNFGCIAVHAAAQAALSVKEALDGLRLTSFAKTSGSRGMHVFVPIRRGPDADNVLAFARKFCERLAAAHPRELTVEHSIEARGQRVYPFRNAFGQTVVTPFSVRRRPKAPVSTPLQWSEVTPGLDPTKFNIGNFSKRLQQSDPWADFFRARQSMSAAAKSLGKL